MSETPLKQLTDSNSNNFYPVTSSSGVYRPDSSTVEAALAAIPTATSDLENDSNFISEGQANSITGSMIQDNAVTAGNIDFATLETVDGWDGYIDLRGKKHRQKIFTGTAGSVGANTSIVLFTMTFPSDMGTVKEDFFVRLDYACDWGELFIKLPWNGVAAPTLGNSSTRTVSSTRYWIRVELIEL